VPLDTSALTASDIDICFPESVGKNQSNANLGWLQNRSEVQGYSNLWAKDLIFKIEQSTSLIVRRTRRLHPVEHLRRTRRLRPSGLLLNASPPQSRIPINKPSSEITSSGYVLIGPSKPARPHSSLRWRGRANYQPTIISISFSRLKKRLPG
jgi:hypothetical protein